MIPPTGSAGTHDMLPDEEAPKTIEISLSQCEPGGLKKPAAVSPDRCPSRHSTGDVDEIPLVAFNAVAGQVQALKERTEALDGLSNKVDHLGKRVDANENAIEKLQDQEGEPLLPEDSYSFLAITREDTSCRRPGWSFLVGIGVLAFQVFTLSLLAVDTIDRDNEGNKLNIPGGVEIQVRLAQFVALIITVISQDEVRLSLNLLYQGYNQDAISYAFSGKINAEVPGEGSSSASRFSCFCSMRFRWYFSISLRLIAGILGLAVTFMLLITQDSVRELLLNFTAVEFVSNVDDAVFLLSKWGYFGNVMKRDADAIADAKWGVEKQDGTETAPLVANRTNEAESLRQRSRKAQPVDLTLKCLPAHSVGLVLTFIGMLTAWLALSLKQQNGDFLSSKTVYVQFGDEFSAALGSFSGFYTVEPQKRARLLAGLRVNYVSVDGSSRFRYFRNESVWTFLYGDSHNDTQRIRVVSSETLTFDVSETAEDPWFYRDPTGRDVPLQHFSMRTSQKVSGCECREEDEDDEDSFECGEDGRWTCKGVLYGERCQFPRSPCMVLEADERYLPFADARSWSLRYDIALMEDNVTIAQAYGHPVYIGNITQNGLYDVMFFVGRRWVLTHTDNIAALKKKRSELIRTNKDFSRDVVAGFFAGDFHAHWTDFEVVFISEPVDVDTPADVPSPVGLNWFRSKALQKGRSVTPLQAPDLNQEEDAVLLCAICDDDENPCVFGKCIEDESNSRRCDCEGGTSGKLCQILPLGDGTCNDHFNTAGNGWDGGDCCPFTCESSRFSCGTNVSVVFGLESREYVGFPHCKDPSQTLCDNSASNRTQPCWKLWVDVRGSEKGAEAGSFVALSGNGQVVAFHEAGANNQVRVFVNNGKAWSERGEQFRMDAGSPSDKISLSSDGNIIAIISKNILQSFHWRMMDNEWEQLGRNFTGMASFALSDDGFTLAAQAQDRSISIHKYVIGEEWILQQNISLGGTPGLGSLALSGDGRTLVVGHADNGTISVFKYSDVKDEDDWIETMVATDDADGINAVEVSANGLVLAAGSNISDVVDLFSYNASDKWWTQKGSIRAIVETESVARIQSLALSSDGSSIAIGVPLSDGIGDHVEFYDFDETQKNWTQFGPDLSVAANDDSGTSIALSRDGNVLAFGAPRHGRDFSGTVRVMWRNPNAGSNNNGTSVPSSPNGNIVDMANITIEVKLDDSPWETSLRLDCGGESYGSIPYGALTTQGKEGDGILQVPKGASCTFEITDFQGDGICCSKGRRGFFRIYYSASTNKTNLLAEGGRLFGSREEVTFRVEDPATLGLIPVFVQMELNTGSPESISASLTCGKQLELTAPRGAFQVSTNKRIGHFVIPMGTDCGFEMLDNGRNGRIAQDWGSFFEIYAQNETNLLVKGFRNEKPCRFIVPGCGCECVHREELPVPMECESESNLVRLELTTNENGADVAWTTTDSAHNTTTETFSDPCSTFVFQTCVPDDECLDFQISNTPAFSGGEVSYQLFLGKRTYANSSSFSGYYMSGVGSEDLRCDRVGSGSGLHCGPRKTILQVNLTLDWFPQDTKWEVRDEFGHVIMWSDDYRSIKYYSDTVVDERCYPENACLIFDIQDLSGNGLCCDNGRGSYTVWYGTDVITGGNFTESEQRLIGDCNGTSAAPTSAPLVTPSPSSLPVDDCQPGATSVYFELSTDRNPEETLWAVFANGEAVMGDGPYTRFVDAFRSFSYQECAKDDDCIQFFISDLGGDGICCGFGEGRYRLYHNSSLIGKGGSFGFNETVVFGCET